MGGLKTYGNRVVKYGPGDSVEVLACSRSIDLAIEAYETARPKLLGARLAVRWGMFTPRRNFKD